MEINRNNTFLDYFYHFEKNKAGDIFLRQPFGDSFKDFTWQETGDEVRRIAAYLRSLNLPDKSNIGLVSKNCAEWIITDLAIMMAGHVSVPFYPTLAGEQIRQVLTHSGCDYLFVGKLDDWAAMKTGIPGNVQCISFPTYNPDPEHLQWKDLLGRYEPLEENHYPKPDDLFTIIYTSGTTGNPKGVMLAFKAMSEAIYYTRDFSRLDIPETRFFSYLPLSHIAERNIVEAIGIASGGTIYFAESLDSFAQNLKSASPTHFLAVPRIWTKFQLGILGKMSQKKLDFLLSIPLISGVVKKKIRDGLGLSKTVLAVTGAAPMPASLIRWFRKLGIVIQEAYGMTENLGVVCIMPKDKIKDGTVGRIYPGIEVKIAEGTHEILTRSPWNMLGYYKEPKMTADTIDQEGWIHTGDVGELDAENYLTITGRIKELYKTSKGEYVAPTQIEVGFAVNPNIEQVCVVGENLPQSIALVVLSDLGKKLSESEIRENLADNLRSLNPKLKSYEKLNKIVVLKEPWTIENNKLTPTLKIKRGVIEKEFGPRFESWYSAPGEVIFE